MPTSTFSAAITAHRHPVRFAAAELDAAVRASFEDSGGNPGTYGSPRVWEDRRGGLGGVEEDGGRVEWPVRVWWAGLRNANGGP